ncbi:MAG: DUF5795 family protein [Halanaeroarchaeum sp.]
MSANRVVQGRMVTPKKLASIIEGEDVMEVDGIEDADRSCPACGGSVLKVGYMPDVTAYREGYKCQDCDWATVDED